AVGPGRTGIEGPTASAGRTGQDDDGHDTGDEQEPHGCAAGSHGAASRTRASRSRKRWASSAVVGRPPYQARSKSSVAPAKDGPAAGTAPPSSTRYSPAVRPGISSSTPRRARSATRARYRQRRA